MIKKARYFIVAIVLFLGFKFNVNANTVDYDRDGSIEIVLHELEEDTYVEGAEIRLYRVADIVKNRVKLTFEYTE